MIKLFLLSILLHIIDDFVLQPICLSKLKQKKWWIEECKRQELDFKEYKNDYKCALLMHSLSWAIMVSLPLLLTDTINHVYLAMIIVLNALLHYTIDDDKANLHVTNLCQDQSLHLLQIIGYYVCVYVLVNT